MKHWKNREYDLEPGEILRMKSGTVILVIKVLGPVATVRLISKGRTDKTPRKPHEVSVVHCVELERLERVERVEQ